MTHHWRTLPSGLITFNKETRGSSSGWIIKATIQTGEKYAIRWGSKIQRRVSVSTAEAETAAINEALKESLMTMPILEKLIEEHKDEISPCSLTHQLPWMP
eukprot:GHVN01033893.1.p1 GENE.GHVN01033893.1~~GHVN01033893.1.p1  ORF type:complete len:101 (-),score=11.02 GHVN01033893.1:964-1266(-)